MTDPTQVRPSLSWLKLKARHIMRLYPKTSRRAAIWDAWFTWIVQKEPLRVPPRKALLIVEATYG